MACLETRSPLWALCNRFSLAVGLHLAALAGCALFLVVQLESVGSRIGEGLDEYSMLSQDDDPGLAANFDFLFLSLLTAPAIYGFDVLALQFGCFVGAFVLVLWSPLAAGELLWLRAVQPNAVQRPPRRCPLRFLRVLVTALFGITVAVAWLGSLPLFIPKAKRVSPGGLTTTAGTSGAKPNFLFIIADDMRALDPYVNVTEVLPQGGFSRLRARGVAFDNAHAPGLKCGPSRTAILTGRSVAVTTLRKDVHAMCWRHYLPGVPSLPEALKATGHWRVEGGGKIWHSRDNIAVYEKEFDRVFGRDGDHSPRYGHPDFCDHIEARSEFVTGHPNKAFGTCGGVMGDQRVVDWARARLREHAAAAPRPEGAKALALFVGLKQTHMPWISPPSALASNLTAELADALVQRLNTTNLLGEAAPLANEQCNHVFSEHVLPRGAAYVQDFAQHWAATYAHADAMINQLLDELDESSLAKNTVVVFTSDHGLHAGERDHVYKDTLWRLTTRVPLVIVVPSGASASMPAGAKRGVRSDPVSLLDLFPTVLQALDAESAAATLDRGLAGRNILTSKWNGVISSHTGKLVHDGSLESMSLFFGAYSFSAADTRFITYDATRDDPTAEELYDVAADPDESRNLGGLALHRAQLRHALATGGAGFAGGNPLLSTTERFVLAPLVVDHVMLPAWIASVLLPIFLLPVLSATGACCGCVLRWAWRGVQARVTPEQRRSTPPHEYELVEQEPLESPEPGEDGEQAEFSDI